MSNLQYVVLFYFCWAMVMVPYWIAKEVVKNLRTDDSPRQHTGTRKTVLTIKAVLIIAVIAAGIGKGSISIALPVFLMILPSALCGLWAGYRVPIYSTTRPEKGNN